MKPCKGCKYFRRSITGNNCLVHSEWASYVDTLSGERVHQEHGVLEAETMRAQSGECGPDRMLYNTNWMIFKHWLWRSNICA